MTSDQRLSPADACLRMGIVIVRLAWAYGITAGPFLGTLLIIFGVLRDHAALRYTGALVLGVTASIVLSDLTCGLAGARSPFGIFPGMRRAGRRRFVLIVPFVTVLLASIAVSLWAAARLTFLLLQ